MLSVRENHDDSFLRLLSPDNNYALFLHAYYSEVVLYEGREDLVGLIWDF